MSNEIFLAAALVVITLLLIFLASLASKKRELKRNNEFLREKIEEKNRQNNSLETDNEALLDCLTGYQTVLQSYCDNIEHYIEDIGKYKNGNLKTITLIPREKSTGFIAYDKTIGKKEKVNLSLMVPKNKLSVKMPLSRYIKLSNDKIRMNLY